MKSTKYLLLVLSLFIIFSACDKKEDSPEEEEDVTNTDGPSMDFKFKFDSNQERLGSFGEPVSVASGNAAQSPRFNGMSAHYVELTPTANTAVGAGVVLYQAAETNKGGARAIDFSKAVIRKDGEVFLSVSLDKIPPGTYKYLRVSLGYQNYDVDFNAMGRKWTGTLASFVGFNNYISSFKINEESLSLNSNKKQGYWAFETHNVPEPYNNVLDGDAPVTTVVNPLHFTSPIPAGSCLVTGEFSSPLVIDGSETEVEVVVSLSSNKSFEWKDENANGEWEPQEGEIVIDMGLRGLKAIATKQ